MAGVGQHFVPRFLMKGFSVEKGDQRYAFVIRERGEPFQTNLTNIGKQRNFYGKEGPGSLDDEITAKEPAYGTLVDRIREGQNISPSDTPELCFLIAHLGMRSMFARQMIALGIQKMYAVLGVVTAPDALHEIFKRKAKDRKYLEGLAQEQAVESGRQLNRKQRRTIGSQAARKTSREAKQFGAQLSHISQVAFERTAGEPAEQARNVHRSALLKAGAEPVARAESFSRMRWSVQRTGSKNFVLGDSPVVCFDANYDPVDMFIDAERLARVALPISSELIVCGTNESVDWIVNHEVVNSASLGLARAFAIAKSVDDFPQDHATAFGSLRTSVDRIDWNLMAKKVVDSA